MYKKRTNRFIEVEIAEEWYLLIEIPNSESDFTALEFWLRKEGMGIMSFVVGLNKTMVIDTHNLDLDDDDAVIKYSFELLQHQIYDYMEYYDEEFQ